MLRLAVARSNVSLEPGLARGLRRQWQPQRLGPALRRCYADDKVDKTVLPGSHSTSTAGVPQAPILATATTNPTPTSSPSPTVPAGNIPRTPPTPAQVQSNPPQPPQPSTNTGNLPPLGTGTASVGPSTPPPKRKRTHRVRNFFTSLLILGALGYAGGVYYSLVSDNFHDFFTEYIPGGEDAVAFFEDRAFRQRFPSQEVKTKSYPQIRGENKVTIGKSSGLAPRAAQTDDASSDLAGRGRHVNALDDNKPKPVSAQQTPSQATPTEQTKAVEQAKKDTPSAAKSSTPPPKEKSSTDAKAPATAPATAPAAPAPPAVTLVDHMNIPQATEPVVQDLVKMVNDIITVINASPEASKYQSTISAAKGDLNKIVGEVTTLKEKIQHEADSKIAASHQEFDTAAKELVRRLEQEMREQETNWRQEYESEREKLSQSYQQKLSTELDLAKKVAEQQTQNQLLEQEIQLQRRFAESVRDKIEQERNGRLAKLDELSTSVSELEKLTGEWNSVVDSNLATQHLHVALEAVRAAVTQAEHPQPFINELVALKEVSKDNAIVNAAIASINPQAYQRGIPTPAHLIDRFRRVASEVRKASLLPEDAGIASHAASAVLSRFMFTKKAERGLPEGDDVEATLARSEVLLEEGDLDSAAREMNALKGWAGVLSRDWVAETRRVLEVRQAVDVIATEARLQSLLVD